MTTRPRPRQERMLRRLAGDFLSLFQGMGLTFGYFISPGRVITQQYPENKDSLRMTPRFRGRLVMPKDEAGNHRCTACGLCEKACPNGSISVLVEKDSTGRKVLGRYLYRLSQCVLCNLCVEACPFGAIVMGQAFALAVYDREQLTLVLNQEKETLDALDV